MKKCPNCFELNGDSRLYCFNCGHKLNQEEKTENEYTEKVEQEEKTISPKIGCGAAILVMALFFGVATESVAGAIVCTIIMLGIFWVAVKVDDKKVEKYKEEKYTITQARYDERRHSYIVGATEKHKEEYLRILKGKQREKLAKLYEQKTQMSHGAVSHIMSMPSVGSKPLDPYIAGGMASALGGGGLGVLTALEQKEKQRQYEASKQAYAEWQDRDRDRRFSEGSCHNSIVLILVSNPETKALWEKDKKEAIERFEYDMREYTIKG